MNWKKDKRLTTGGRNTRRRRRQRNTGDGRQKEE